jgi:hypothetical protein
VNQSDKRSSLMLYGIDMSRFFTQAPSTLTSKMIGISYDDILENELKKFL